MQKEPPPVGGKLCETCGGAKKSRLLWEAAFSMPENPWDFQAKGLQSAACIICVPMAHKFHTGSLRGIFSHAHVARENDFNSLPPAGGKLCEAFFDTLTGLKAYLAFGPAPYRQR